VTTVMDVELSALWNATNNKGLWQGVFVKLAAYMLTDYSRVIVVDADLLMVQGCVLIEEISSTKRKYSKSKKQMREGRREGKNKVKSLCLLCVCVETDQLWELEPTHRV